MGNTISVSSLLSGTLAAQDVGTEAGIATLRKSNDIAKQAGEALVQMLEESLAQVNERILDIYA